MSKKNYMIFTFSRIRFPSRAALKTTVLKSMMVLFAIEINHNKYTTSTKHFRLRIIIENALYHVYSKQPVN